MALGDRRLTMTMWARVVGAVLFGMLGAGLLPAADDAPKQGAKADDALVGTWKLVSATYEGQASNLPQVVTTVKHVTPAQFMWATYGKDGKVTRALGGTYTLKGDEYVEIPEYRLGATLDALKGKPQVFQWKVEGNKWYHTGKLSGGTSIEEVWQRVEKK
jgi:hypothetical protein